ncbi:hypothetical protein M405DRAFT_833788 [Rhizopogon salebrosus TDB-379]|nr:hypothetical protein M405DRAFT_833788 [Rhizopogon salebrosus TDB-379]
MPPHHPSPSQITFSLSVLVTDNLSSLAKTAPPYLRLSISLFLHSHSGQSRRPVSHSPHHSHPPTLLASASAGNVNCRGGTSALRNGGLGLRAVERCATATEKI